MLPGPHSTSPRPSPLMRCLLGVTLLALSPWVAIPRAAAQTTPAKVLDVAEHVLVERAAGVRDYSLVIRSAFGELTVYARREAGEWRFEHDAAEDDLTVEYVLMPLEFA